MRKKTFTEAQIGNIVANLRSFATVKKLLHRIIEHDNVGYDDATLVHMLREGLARDPAINS